MAHTMYLLHCGIFKAIWIRCEKMTSSQLQDNCDSFSFSDSASRLLWKSLFQCWLDLVICLLWTNLKTSYTVSKCKLRLKFCDVRQWREKLVSHTTSSRCSGLQRRCGLLFNSQQQKFERDSVGTWETRRGRALWFCLEFLQWDCSPSHR